MVVSTPLAAAAHTASFHPHDPDRLCTTGGGVMEVWRVRALWAKFDVQKQPGFGSGLLPGGVQVACHAWAPNVSVRAAMNVCLTPAACLLLCADVGEQPTG